MTSPRTMTTDAERESCLCHSLGVPLNKSGSSLDTLGPFDSLRSFDRLRAFGERLDTVRGELGKP